MDRIRFLGLVGILACMFACVLGGIGMGTLYAYQNAPDNITTLSQPDLYAQVDDYGMFMINPANQPPYCFGDDEIVAGNYDFLICLTDLNTFYIIADEYAFLQLKGRKWWKLKHTQKFLDYLDGLQEDDSINYLEEEPYKLKWEDGK